MDDRETGFVIGPSPPGLPISASGSPSQQSEDYLRRMRFFKRDGTRRMGAYRRRDDGAPTVRTFHDEKRDPMTVDKKSEAMSTRKTTQSEKNTSTFSLAQNWNFWKSSRGSDTSDNVGRPKAPARRDYSFNRIRRRDPEEEAPPLLPRATSQSVISSPPSSPLPPNIPSEQTSERAVPSASPLGSSVVASSTEPLPAITSPATENSVADFLNSLSDPSNPHAISALLESSSSETVSSGTANPSSRSSASRASEAVNVSSSSDILRTSAQPSRSTDNNGITSSISAPVSTATPVSSSVIIAASEFASSTSSEVTDLTRPTVSPSSTTQPLTDEASIGSLGPHTPEKIGGVVGGLAGGAIILLVLLCLLRRHKRRLRDRDTFPSTSSHEQVGCRLSTRLSQTPLVRAMPPFKKLRPSSSHTNATVDTARSESGFQRVAGRKIDPVLLNGGDGYGGSYGVFEKTVAQPSGSETAWSIPRAGRAFASQASDSYSDPWSARSSPIGHQIRPARSNPDATNILDADNGSKSEIGATAAIRPSLGKAHDRGKAEASPPGYETPEAVSNDAITPWSDSPSYAARPGLGARPSHDDGRGSRFTEDV